jgi:hypothetical protein
MRIVRVTLRRSETPEATDQASAAAALAEAVRDVGGITIEHVSTPVATDSEIELAIFVPAAELACPARWNDALTTSWQRVCDNGTTGWVISSGFITDNPW